MTNDVSCQAGIETGFQSPSNENSLLITAFNSRIYSLKKELNEKQVFIETLLKSFQNCPYSNIVATSNHKIDNFFLKISTLLKGK